MISGQDIKSHYLKYFYTLKASSEELREQAYKIRYQVYYEEQKMISAQEVGDRYETDVWDSDSIHSLLFHRPSNRPIGNIRLILLGNKSNKMLPIEEHYQKSFDLSAIHVSHLRTGKTGEISRMAILSSFRRRAADNSDSYGLGKNNEAMDGRRFPINYMPMCLTFAAINLMIEQRLDYGIALMEPRLARLLGRYGVTLKQVGQTIDYFGSRAPYLIFPESTQQNIAEDYRGLFDIIGHELGGS
ncbi:MAG: PEP-CTERM/exosortase system-associated acyltransferase [Gammaproteobacteria bacterium]